MEHQSLYRKYRPASFDDVIGQNQVVQTLINQINKNEIGHAYLFCGTRGTGKTSCARLFAKAINCLNPVNGSPCGECEVCKALEKDVNLDILEIDAASNNKVEEVRDLREKIKYLPTSCKYKVYIIDEVHMLTDSAFNALLKTLEEPPRHAVFILATTEPQKLPATILSRCMRFDFKTVSENDLVEHLRNIFKEEKVTFDEESLRQIALAGEGSVRDTLSVADMCMSFCDGNITIEKCLDCLGATNFEILAKLTNAIFDRDCSRYLTLIDELLKDGKNLTVIVKDLSSFLKNVLTIKLVKNSQEIVKYPKSVFDLAQDCSTKATEDYIIQILNTLANLEAELKFSLNPRIKVEVSVLQTMTEETKIQELEKKIARLEKIIANSEIPVIISNTQESEQVVNSANRVDDKVEEEKKVEVKKEISKNLQTESQPIQTTSTNGVSPQKIFGEMLNYLRDNNQNYLYATMSRIKSVNLEDNKLILLTDQRTADALNTKYAILQSIVSEINNSISIMVKVQTEQDKAEMLKNKFGDKLKIV